MQNPAGQTFSEVALISLSPLSGPLQATLCALTLAATLWVMVGYMQAQKPAALLVLRGLAGLLVCGFLLEPALERRAVRRIKNRVAIVLDRSRSMSLPAQAGPPQISRHAALQAFMTASEAALKKLGEHHLLDFYDLQGPLAATAAVQAPPPTGDTSDLLRALEQVTSSDSGRPLAGIVLISDGADNAELGDAHSELPDAARDRLQKLAVRVNTMDASFADAFRDVAVAELASDEFAFVHNTFSLQAVIVANGYESLQIPVTLRKDGVAISTQQVTVTPAAPAKVTFRIKPEQIGEFVYGVSVPPQSDETVTQNNDQTVVVQVIRDKIRVLQVAGRPNWDERFLRQHLKENPNADLVSFFILRTPSDDLSIPESELSLIPFPVGKLFTSELSSFDVVIFQNFDFRPYHMAPYLPNIRDAVHAGLGFVMVGGPESFAQGGYVGTALEEILPVRLTPASPAASSSDADQALLPGPIRPMLTQAGAHHPATHLAQGGSSNAAAWQALPPWSAANRLGGLQPAAAALLVDGQAHGGDGKPLPLLAAMDVGNGRSMALATDSTWRWRFHSKSDGGAAERAYSRLWSNMLRWLVRDPEHARVRVTPHKRQFEAAEPVEIDLSVLGRDYEPVAGAHVAVTLLQADKQTEKQSTVVTGERGLAQVRFEGLAAGAYRLTAHASALGEALGDGSGVFVVHGRSVEILQGTPRPALLAALAASTGGAHLALLPQSWQDIKVDDPKVLEVANRQITEIWDNGFALAAGLTLLVADWALRRRRGYL